MTLFKIFFWLGMLGEVIVRAPFARRVRAEKKAERRVSATEKAMLGLLAVSGFILPLIYTITPWLDFANYTLPTWLGWVGVFLMAAAVYIFARGHLDLKTNWSPSLEIYEGHTLVTNGIYRVIRHPMYASQWLLSFAQILLLQNWIAGPIALIVFIPFYFLRVPAEEKMMLETFGEQYRHYMGKVGGVIPKSLR